MATIPENLGTIRIELFRVKNVRRVRRQPRRSGKGSSSKHRERGTNLSGVPTMSEKSKTVGFHTISWAKLRLLSNCVIIHSVFFFFFLKD